MQSQGRDLRTERGRTLNLGKLGKDARSPRVLKSFAIYMGLALILAAAIVLFLMRHNVEANAKQRSIDQARLAATLIVPQLVPEDAWDAPLAGVLLSQADKVVDTNLLPNGGKEVRLYGTSGRLLFAMDPNVRDATGETERMLKLALADGTASMVTRIEDPISQESIKTIATFAKVTYPGAKRPAGVLVSFSDYNAVASGVRDQALPLAGAIMAIFLLLYLALLPILRRTTSQLSFTNDELRRRAEDLNDNLIERAAIEQRLRETIRNLERSENALEHSQEETILRLSMAVESRDQETGDHIERMGRYCALLAEKIGWNEARCDLLRIAAPLHDVGKIGIPDSILLKPGKLTPEERDEIERHAQIGHDILAGSDSPLLDLASRIALTHHEHWDGRGYPRGLAEEEIPVEGRMAAIADVFDALTSDRVYRPAMSIEKALGIMSEGRGTHFDPKLLDVFFDSIVEVLMIRDGHTTTRTEPDVSPQGVKSRRPQQSTATHNGTLAAAQDATLEVEPKPDGHQRSMVG